MESSGPALPSQPLQSNSLETPLSCQSIREATSGSPPSQLQCLAPYVAFPRAHQLQPLPSHPVNALFIEPQEGVIQTAPARMTAVVQAQGPAVSTHHPEQR